MGDPLRVPDRRRLVPRAALAALLLANAHVVLRRASHSTRAYGLLQLVVAQGGGNLDSLFVKPLTRGASAINVYGSIEGTSVYRPNALTGDPNHLGIMLLLPLLVVSPIYLRLEPGHRLRRKLAVLIAFLLLTELATLSRSGALGLIVGALVLVAPYRRLLWTRAAALPLVLVAIPVTLVVLRRLISSRP